MAQIIDTRTKILTENPFRLMIELSLPAIVGMVVVGLYSFMDAIFLGQMVGSSAMTAVSIAYPFTLINSGISTLLGIGSASVLSRAIGRKDEATINKIMGNMVALVLILSTVSTIVGITFAEDFLKLSGAQGEVLSSAVKYLHIVFLGSIFVNFAQAANMIMRGEGVLKKAMLIMSLGAGLNIILDPILIEVFKKFGMGVEGAAFATIISQVIQAIITLQYFRKKSKIVHIGKIKIEKALAMQVFAIGVSAMLMQVLTMIQQTVMFNMAAQYGGSQWQAVLSASIRIQCFAFIPLWGISQGFQPAVGTNYGAKEYDRVRKITAVFVGGATALALLLYIPVQLAPRAMLSLFIKESEIVSMGVGGFQVMFSTFFLLGFMIISITFFQALGKASIAGIITILRQIVLFVPLVVLLPKISNLGIYGVFLATAVTDALLFIFCVVVIVTSLKNLEKTSVKSTKIM